MRYRFRRTTSFIAYIWHAAWRCCTNTARQKRNTAPLAPRRKTLQSIWSRRAGGDAELAAELQTVLRAASLDVFIRIYPDSKDMLRAAGD